MKHLILVKWKDPVEMKDKVRDIRRIFEETLSIEGVHEIAVMTSCSDRANRFDLMIEMTMDQSALPAYDESAPHHEWKDTYGSMILSKTIFDYEQ